MTDTQTDVTLLDIARRLPGMALDALGMIRGALGMLVRPDDKASVGLHFQRAARRNPLRTFVRFEGREYSYLDANAEVNRYASVLTERGCGAATWSGC